MEGGGEEWDQMGWGVAVRDGGIHRAYETAVCAPTEKIY